MPKYPIATAVKEDARIMRSKRDLRAALMELLKSTPFEKIAVIDICNKAMINKVTFYKHYADKYDLFDDCLKDIGQDIFARVNARHPHSFFLENPTEFCLALLEETTVECVNRRETLRTLVCSDNALNNYIVHNYIEKMIVALIDEISSSLTLKMPAKSLAAFLTGGFSMIICEQINNPAAFNRAEFMGYCREIFTDIVRYDVLVRK